LNPGSFFAELKRRNVYKVAVAYAVVGWLIAQVATQIFPFLEIPNWVVRLVIVLIAIGFPIALVIAWAFEATPEGIKRTEVADAKHEHSRGKTWIYVVIIGAAISAALFFLGRYTVGNKNVAASANELPAKSIAVLPFENLSSDKENSYFADGIQDEILTKLATIADLKVISRTSTEKYKSKPEDLRTVSQQLGVANVLEGSVQKAGDKVRVNVQLIDARADSHLWAKSYDGDAKDIFGVESEVSQQVADALQAKLSPTEAKAIATAPTTDAASYDLYLKAESEFRAAQSSFRPDSFQQADNWYRQAIALDPSFALAIARLAQCQLTAHWFVKPLSKERLEEIKSNIEHALSIAPNLAEAHNASGLFYYFGRRAYPEALAEFARAIELQPNNSVALEYSGYVHRRQGQWQQALNELNHALEQDPRNASLAASLANTYDILRMHDEAQRLAKRAVSLDPHEVTGMITWINSIMRNGDAEEALRVLATFPADTKLTTNTTVPGFSPMIGYRAWVFAFAREFDAAVQVWDNSSDEGRQFAARSAIHLLANDLAAAQSDAEKARPLLERRLQDRPDDTAALTELAWVYLGLRRNAKAVATARRATEIMPPSRDVLAGNGLRVGLAQVEAHAGMVPEAIAIVREALLGPGGGPVSIGTLKNDPVWEPLRSDPQFQQLLTIKEHVGP
jgi:TolB-like protein/Tfp pilus assembly protein PilF